MAFVSRVGNLLNQSGSKHANVGLSSSSSLLFQGFRNMSSAKLFVGGLAYAIDEIGLRIAFQQYGEVIEARVIADPDSGRSRGFGFVSYTSTDAAKSALQEMDGKTMIFQLVMNFRNFMAEGLESALPKRSLTGRSVVVAMEVGLISLVGVMVVVPLVGVSEHHLVVMVLGDDLGENCDLIDEPTN